jgi:2-phosphoglycerate kinase
VYAAVSWWKIFSKIRSSSFSSNPVIVLIRGGPDAGIGGKVSPERGVARDCGIDELIKFDRLLERLREKLEKVGVEKPGEFVPL